MAAPYDAAVVYERRLRHAVGAEDLTWIEAVLWPDRGPQVVTDAPARTPLLVLPDRSHPWLIAPDQGLVAGLRALATGGRLLTRRQRVVRAGAAATLVTGLSRRRVSRLEVTTRPDDLLARLGSALGEVAPMIHMGEADPNRKPTVQLVDRRGSTVGYAKVGWNSATRGMVRREAAALAAVARPLSASGAIRVPAVVLSECYDDLGLDVLVTAAVPATARREAAAEVLDDATVRAVARAVGGPETSSMPARRSGWWRELLDRVESVSDIAPEAAATVRRSLEATAATLPTDTALPTTGWHGDLVPWNLARDGEGLWIWDWEHAGRGRPMGLDLLHARLAVDLNVRRRELTDAVRGVLEVATERLPSLGVAAELVPAVVSGYLVERWLRAAELARVGAGWDAAVHPGLVVALAAVSPR